MTEEERDPGIKDPTERVPGISITEGGGTETEMTGALRESLAITKEKAPETTSDKKTANPKTSTVNS